MSHAILSLQPAEKLPRDVLGKIFGYAIYHSLCVRDHFVWCRHPYIYCIRCPTSARIQLTCKHWYTTWKHAYILTGFFARDFPWCVKPREHLTKHARYVMGMINGVATLPFIIVPTLEADGEESLKVLPARYGAQG